MCVNVFISSSIHTLRWFAWWLCDKTKACSCVGSTFCGYLGKMESTGFIEIAVVTEGRSCDLYMCIMVVYWLCTARHWFWSVTVSSVNTVMFPVTRELLQKGCATATLLLCVNFTPRLVWDTFVNESEAWQAFYSVPHSTVCSGYDTGCATLHCM